MGLERIEYEGDALVRVIALGSTVTVGQESYQSDLTKTYLQLTLLNSFPTVNARGMTLLPPLLTKAASTANNQPLNLDHQMIGNPEPEYKGTDLVVGAMLKAYYASTGEIQLLPDVSDPLKIVAVLWNRVPEAQKIIASIGDGEKQYRVSFEIIFAMDESGWVVFGEDGPSYVTEISEDLMNAWEAKQYDKVALAVGGDGSGRSTHIWGGGFTLIPADENAGIDAILTGNFQPNAAIAAVANNKIETKEPIVNLIKATAATMKTALAKINALIAQSGFTVQVAGGDKLSLDLAGNQIEQPDDFCLYGYKRSNGEYNISASLYMDQPGIDGFVQKVRLEYEPNDTGDFELTEVETAAAKVLTPRELTAQVEAHVATIAGFAGYLSPTEVQAKIAEAVAAIKPADTKDLLTREQADKMIADSNAARDAIEEAMTTRSEALVANGFVLTEERKSHLTTFAADEAGNTAFTAWLTSLKTAQAAMLADLAGKGIEASDSIKAAVACLNDKGDSGFTALVASHVEPAVGFNPSMPVVGDAPLGDGNLQGVM